MTPDELRTLVLTIGLDCRVDKEEVTLRVCTFCGNEKWNLQLNAGKGFYSCWACKAGGRLDRFLTQATGKDFHIPTQRGEKGARAQPAQVAGTFKTASLEVVLSARVYLESRGLPWEVAESYGMAVCIELGHQLYGRIVIPARDFWSGEILGWVGRNYTSGRPKYLSTMTSRVITGWPTRGGRTPCVLVEGHLDGVAVHRAGFAVGVLGGTGAGDLELFVARLVTRPLVILLDGDAVDRATQLSHQLKSIHPDVRLQPLEPTQDPANLPIEVLQDLLSHQSA